MPKSFPKYFLRFWRFGYRRPPVPENQFSPRNFFLNFGYQMKVWGPLNCMTTILARYSHYSARSARRKIKCRCWNSRSVFIGENWFSMCNSHGKGLLGMLRLHSCQNHSQNIFSDFDVLGTGGRLCPKISFRPEIFFWILGIKWRYGAHWIVWQPY